MGRRETRAVLVFACPLVSDGVSTFIHLCRDSVKFKRSANQLEAAGGRNS